MKMALCLSGGGVKGAAHIGALKAFEEANIEFNYISGTSSGSIVASLYAVGYSSDEIYHLFKKYAKKIRYIDMGAIIKILKNLITKRKFIVEGLNSGRAIEKAITDACAKKGIYTIGKVQKELLVPSVALDTGKIYFFNSMKRRTTYSDEVVYDDRIEIGKAVMASSSYPGVFCPCEYNGIRLIDGGIRENTPWREWKKVGVDKVICIGFETQKETKEEKNMVDVISDSLGILCHELSNYELYGVDYLLKIQTKDVSLLDTKQIEYLYEQGYKQAKQFIKVELNKIL